MDKTHREHGTGIEPDSLNFASMIGNCQVAFVHLLAAMRYWVASLASRSAIAETPSSMPLVRPDDKTVHGPWPYLALAVGILCISW